MTRFKGKPLQFMRSISTSINYETYMTQRTLLRKPSPIRALQPLVSLPGMISLGGGMPNPQTFPFEKIQVQLKTNEILPISAKDFENALQYTPTPGIPELVQILLQMQIQEHRLDNPSNPLSLSITTGSQDALSKAFDMLVDSNDSLLVENPTYSGSLAHLHPVNCRLVCVDTDKDGLIPESLQHVLETWDEKLAGKKPKILYTIPNGSNPTGACLTIERKKQIYKIAQENQLLILEDDPYYYLQFAKERTPSFFSMDTDGRVLRFDSLSKILSAGIRVGYVTGPKQLVEKIDFHTQAANLHSSGISQLLVLGLLRTWKSNNGFQTHVNSVCAFYKERRDLFLTLAEKHLKGLVEWNVPTAGMFVWLRLVGIEDSFSLIQEKAVESKVLFVPGSAFAPDNKPSPFIRASYSTATPQELEIALERLAKLLRQEQK